MKNDFKTAGNRPRKGRVSKLRNQFPNIPLTQVVKPVVQTNTSAAC